MKTFYFVLILILGGGTLQAQTFNFSLTGNPVNTTGWTLSSMSYVNNDAVVLTDPQMTQAGYIYYSTPQNLANCSQFTVSFDFKITNSSSPTADGIAFWYISNPPTAFVNGGGLGLPSNPNGLVLLLDTYNNDGFPDNNPLISLRRYNGTTLGYTEGNTTGQLAPDVTYQSFVADGNWHTCVLSYSFGTVSVSFDNNPPVITGTTTLNINGYFGFSASTGALWARHSIKNVSISGAPDPDPPVTTALSYCQNDPAIPLTASGTDLRWYSTQTGGSPLPTAPTPNTSVPGTFTWYVSTYVPGCNLESDRVPLTVTVNPLPRYDRYDTICPGESVSFYGRQLFHAGSYDTTMPAGAGQCDSMIVFHVYQSTAPAAQIVPNEDFDFCEGDTVSLEVRDPLAGTTYQWLRNGTLLPGATNNTITTGTGGRFQVIVTRNTCSDTSLLITATRNPRPAAEILDPEVADICAGDTLQLSAQAGTGYQYVWEPEIIFKATTGNDQRAVSGIFLHPKTKVLLDVTNEFGCQRSDEIWILTHACCMLQTPSAFSPNGDGLNDFFKPNLGAGQYVKEFSIYDRYGGIVYRSFNNGKGWDGRYPDGSPAPLGTYMYFLKYSCAYGKVFTEKGDITLMR